MIKTSRRGNQYQNIFCKARTSKDGQYINYVGYFTIGNRVYKICPSDAVSADKSGNDGIWCTVVATSLSPRRGSNGGAKF